ncbi:PilC/PilY family type IV pilus protein [Xylophilus sp. GW821-FHT01B05]
MKPFRSIRHALPVLALCCVHAASAVTLADQPVLASADVPGNLALALSVEYPTAISVANLGNYADASTYLGYFDPLKCYTYSYDSGTAANSYFQPAGLSTGTNKHSCSGMWSGNFMNWATMQTIDPFRWALTGGYRAVDTTSSTILQKAWGANQGSQSNFPLRGTDQGTGHKLSASLISSVVPMSWSAFNTSIWTRGSTMVFSGTGTGYSNTGTAGTDWQSLAASNDATTTYRVYIRVKVCDPGTTGTTTGGVESNCVLYPNGQYKPEGLLQQYANKIRYSAFSYLNGLGSGNQGGVLRAPMGFIGPTYPTPLSATLNSNSKAEWDSGTGIMNTNPDTATASATTTASGVTVSNSGVMNYLNKFGVATGSYMTYDNVSELYYAVVRYFQNLGNVATWTSYITAATTSSDSTRTALLDGFPAVSTWADPITYSCQRNFVLGIGDANTHYDVNVGGGTLSTSGRTKPAGVTSDSFNKAQAWTNAIETLEGLTGRASAWGDKGSEYIAGLAYGSHVNDIRSDLTGTQNISTYWMDVMEYQVAKDKNPYWLAAKYGGFTAPSGYDITQTTTPLINSWWNSSGDTINMNGTTEPRPDNYFLAGNASQMVAGLTKAFSNIASAVSAYTTSFSLSSAQVSSAGAASYAAQYASKGWSGVVTATTLAIASDGTTTTTAAWNSTSTLATQLAGAGWNTGRQVVTWSGTAGTPFRYASLTSAQQSALITSYRGSDGSDYLKYLRGDQSQESGSTTTGSSQAYRARSVLLGDIVDSKVVPVVAPSQTYTDALNPGYAAFKAKWASRPTVVYVGANDGMLHGFNGATSGTGAGAELFAYVPNAVFQGPNATPQTDGLAALGNPSYAHHYYVDATPQSFDIDFNNAGGSFTTTSAATSDWRTVLIGGLGKGGKSFYAIDVTNPAGMTTETAVAGNVLWEFTDDTMGYSFGEPVVVKTKKYGWVVILTSGYNNSDGYGYLYFLDPKTGSLLEKVKTGVASSGLAHAAGYVRDYTDGTADAIYAGDLNGQVWRFDVSGSGVYPAPLLMANLTNASGTAEPVTTQPLIEIHPTTRKRYVMLGSGQMLASSDVNSSTPQTFYALLDGTAAAFNTAALLPSGVSFPLKRSNLTALTNLTLPATFSSTSMGWYVDLGVDSSTGTAWRVIVNPTAGSGLVAFAATLTTPDACSPSGTSRLYVLNFGTGQSSLLNNVAYIPYTGAITDMAFVSANGTTRLVVGLNDGSVLSPSITPSASVSLHLLNWREIPTVN